MKVAIVSANFGDMDIPKMPPRQAGYEVDFYMFNESNAKFKNKEQPLDRVKARYVKLQMIQSGFLKEKYDINIWVDGSILIQSPAFIKHVVDKLGPNDIMLYFNSQYSTLYEQGNMMIEDIEAGDKYLSDRYNPKQIQQQMDDYAKTGYDGRVGLFATKVFAFKDTPATKKLFNMWWAETQKYPESIDQMALPYVIAKMGEAAISLSVCQDNIYDNFNFKVMPHKKP